MQRTRQLMVGTVAAGSLAVAGIGTAFAASSASTHTLTFTAIQTTSHNIGKTGFINAEKDVSHGKYLGNDIVTGTFNAAQGVAKAHVALAIKGGFIYGSFTIDQQGTLSHGKVTGGTGKYAGVTGTINGTAASQTREKVTVTYHH
jgi:hypothetical protein